MTIEVLDPTYGEEAGSFASTDRVADLRGVTIGFVSNGKQGTRPFFDALEAVLRADYGVADVVRETKTNYSAPAGDDIMDRAKRWNALVAGIGD